ncbi:MAG: glycosyl hydrolase, partial [Acidobacteria bacterium]|nr:glycosyl hydrolase [Acidobacteriota bacterium]
LFKPEDAYRTTGGGGFPLPPTATVGENPGSGVVVNYWLKDKVSKEVKIEFLDPSGSAIRTFTKRAEGSGGGDGTAPGGGGGGRRGGGGDPAVSADAGLNTFVWNFRRPNAATIDPLILWAGSITGPRVPPGNYQVRLSVDGKPVGTESFAIKEDPRVPVTQADLDAQYDLMMKIHDKLNATHGAILDIREMKTQLDGVRSRVRGDKALADMVADITKKLTSVEEALVQTKIHAGQDALNFPIRLNNKLAALSSSVDSSDAPPTAQQLAVFADLSAQVDKQLAELARIKSSELADFNKQYSAKGLPVVSSTR